MVSDPVDPMSGETRPSNDSQAPDPRFEGYQPRRPVAPSERVSPERSDAKRPGARTARPPSARPREARRSGRRWTTGLAAAVATAAFVVGLMLGWVARGGPPKAEIVVTTQAVPAVTITKEVTP